jgi:hypothetical protein
MIESNELLLKEIYEEILYIRNKLDTLEKIIIPEEEITPEELEEINILKNQSLKGENIEWDKLKKELL